MGKRDRRNSLKMTRKKAQVKKKARAKRVAAAKGAASERKTTKKPRSTKASAPPASKANPADQLRSPRHGASVVVDDARLIAALVRRELYGRQRRGRVRCGACGGRG